MGSMERKTLEELRKLTPFERKNCYDCKWCQASIGWWCRNDEVAKARGTRIPGVNFCFGWKPDWDYIDEKYKKPEFGYQRVLTRWEKFVRWWQRLFKKP